jgi:AraC-like DNA-binding protein
MPKDRLDALLQRFSVTARMFHSGPLCGVTDFYAFEDLGQLHVVKRGTVIVDYGKRKRERIEEPSIIFYPRPLKHRFITDANAGADMACANVSFNMGSVNPLAQALPPVVVIPLRELEADAILDALFREAFTQQCGRQHVVNRLFEVAIIVILRTLMNRSLVDQGMLAGMAHPQLAKALIAMHESPARAWPLEKLAVRAGMSRSHFAAVFHEVIGTTPADYLAKFRISIAQDLLRRGQGLKLIAEKVGYGSAAAFSRAFGSLCGQTPRAWKQQVTGDAVK